MLRITVPETSLWDSAKEVFLIVREQTLMLEHSLISVSKWESKWNKAFLADNDKTDEETLDYVKCMTLNSKTDPLVYSALSRENLEEINAYISAPMTATTIHRLDGKKSPRKETITSELIYCWMIQLGVPFECEKWHLNRLLTLIEVISVKNAPPKKRSKREIMAANSELNRKRRAALNSKG